MPDSTMYVHLIVMHFPPPQTLHIYFVICQKAVAQSTKDAVRKRMSGDSECQASLP